LRAETVEGLRRIAEAGLEPDLVYVDADHSFEHVVADLQAAMDLFPKAAIVGDDWDWEGVHTAIETLAKQRDFKYDVHKTAWQIIR
jgi:hypothetical protein